MADPTRAEAARNYFSMLGVRPSRPRPRPAIEDDDYDIEIGRAEMEPSMDVSIGEARMIPNEDIDIEIGPAEIEPRSDMSARETVLPEIRIEGDPGPRVSQRLGNLSAALPEWISEPLNRSLNDPESMVGRVARGAADVADTVGVPDPLDDEMIESMETFGQRGADALAGGFGHEIGAAVVRPFSGRGDDDQERVEQSQRQRLREMSGRHPVASAAGTIAGSLPLAVATPGPTSTSRLARIAQAGRNNAILGAVTGAGLSESDDLIDVDEDGGIGGRIGDAISGAAWGGIGGAAGQALGEGAGWARDAWRAFRNPTGPALDVIEPVVSRSAALAEGSQAADSVRRLLSRENADDVVNVLDDELIDVDLGAQTARRLPRDGGSIADSVGESTAPQRIGSRGRPPVDDDEFLGAVVDRPGRAAPQMPQQGPELRAAAMRGERSFGARGDAALDPSIAATEELSAMARDYADIEGGVGGFQPLKDRRIAEAMADYPPPDGWQDRSTAMIDQIERRLEMITRHAGANPRIANATGEARLSLERARDMLLGSSHFGAQIPPSEVYRQINRANMSIGRAAAQEARGTGSGMQHTSAFAEPLTDSYQQLRAFLADERSWGAAARVQREMNSITAPLLRTGRALRDRVGNLFQDSAEQAAQGGGFRTYETARPDAVRGLMSRAGDDAYADERQLLRAWVENYGEQGATLARISNDPALGPRAQAMQARARRLLDILDRAEVDGRAAQMLQSVEGTRLMGRGPSVGQMVRLAARIESGEITAPEMRGAIEALNTLERTLSRSPTGLAEPIADRIQNDAAMAVPEVDPVAPPQPADTPRWRRDIESVDQELEANAPQQVTDEDEDALPQWMRDLR